MEGEGWPVGAFLVVPPRWITQFCGLFRFFFVFCFLFGPPCSNGYSRVEASKLQYHLHEVYILADRITCIIPLGVYDIQGEVIHKQCSAVVNMLLLLLFSH